MHKDGISIVIVTWNTKDVIDECLENINSAIKNASYPVEVVVVDNASEDGTANLIRKKYPWVRLVLSGQNLGFAKGNNLGFKKTDPKYKFLLLLNSDVFIGKDSLNKSVEFFEENKEVSVMGSRLNSRDGRLLPSAGFLPTPSRVFFWMIGLSNLGVHPKSKSFFNKQKEVGWVQGAYLFLKRNVFVETKGFDENFFMYMEEVEWCNRVKKLGYRIFYNPDISAIHLDKASALGIPENLIKVYGLEVLGLKYYLKKYYPKHLFYLIPIIKIGVLARLLAFSILRNNLRRKAYSNILKQL